MAAEVKLAVAGAGKTTWLGKMIDPNKKNLLITFTNLNVENLIKSVKESHNGVIPANTEIMTYTKFVYYWIIKPNEKLYLCKSGKKLKGKGMTIVEPIESDRNNPGNGYVKDAFPRHFLDENSRYYVRRLSELFVKQKATVKKAVREYIGKFVDEIYIDEFQDFINFDLKLILDIGKGKSYNITMVGDYYQSLVTYGGKVKKSQNIYRKLNYDQFIEYLEKEKIKVDTATLVESWRCSPKVCSFIRANLGINIFPKLDNKKGEVNIVSNIDVALSILADHSIVKLFYDEKSKGYNKLKSKNKWGYSKGSTFEKTCVILTGRTSNLFLNREKNKITKETLHKLYVALTRSSSDTYLIPKKIYDIAISLLTK